MSLDLSIVVAYPNIGRERERDTHTQTIHKRTPMPMATHDAITIPNADCTMRSIQSRPTPTRNQNAMQSPTLIQNAIQWPTQCNANANADANADANAMQRQRNLNADVIKPVNADSRPLQYACRSLAHTIHHMHHSHRTNRFPVAAEAPKHHTLATDIPWQAYRLLPSHQFLSIVRQIIKVEKAHGVEFRDPPLLFRRVHVVLLGDRACGVGVVSSSCCWGCRRRGMVLSTSAQFWVDGRVWP